MNYWDILKRSLEITWVHKPLWLFGFLQALFSGGDFRFSPGSFPSNTVDPDKITKSAPRNALDVLNPVLIVILVFFGLAIIVLAIFLSFLSQAALIGMVAQIENEGNTRVRSGFDYGLRSWLQLLMIALLVGIPYLMAMLFVGGVLFLPAILSFLSEQVALGVGLVVLGALLFIPLVLATGVPLVIVTSFAFRFRVLDGTRPVDSIRQGYQLFRKNLRSALLMWLILIVVGIVAGMAIFMVLLIVGIPIFLLGLVNIWLAIPLAVPVILGIMFLAGLMNVFTSCAWTLTFFNLSFGPLHASATEP